MRYWIVNTENLAILTLLPAPRAIFLDIELYFWIVFLDCIFGSAYGLSKNTVQKYNPKIQSNIDGNGVNIARL